MNFYALIPLLAFVINVFTLAYILAQKGKKPVNRAYSFFAFCLALWMLEVFFLWSNLPDRFLMPLEKLTTTTGFLVALSFLNFVYVFIERKRDFFFKFFSFVIFSSIFINVFTNLYVKGYQKYTWGASLEGGPLFIELAFLALALPSLYSIYLIHEKYRKASARHEKQQLSLLIQGSLLSYVIIFISDLIVPYIFGIKTFPRIGIPSCAIQSLFVFAAVNKFNFLSIGIEEAAKDLFTNVKDAVILTDNYGNIVQLNDSALEIIGRSAKTVFNIFENYEFNQDYNDYETSVGRDSERIVAISQATIKQGNVGIGKIIIARDITAGKKAERELKSSKEKLEQLAQELARINASLEQKVLERTRSLEEVNAQLRQEIAERRRAEEALAAEKERLAVTLRSIGDGVITTDTAGRIALLNKAAEDMTGWTQEEAIGQPLEAVLRLLDDKTHLPCESLVAEVLRTHDVVSRDRPSLLQARHGQEYLVAENAAPIHDRDGRLVGVVVVFRDVTERRRIEEELLKADKLESIGVLAGGIAHDFNNILTAILGNISLAKLYVGDHPKAAARLASAEKAALQAQNLTQQLLAFSTGGTLVKRPTSVADIIRAAVDFSLRGSNVKCELVLAEDLWSVEADAGQLAQVMNNLIINADQAMPEGGTLEVRAENVFIDEKTTGYLYPRQPGPYVRITVKDQGVGIAEDVLAKIFDPYFTTKPQGSGLGLFTSYSIVKNHGGHIAVESALGQGTTFYVYLPATPQRAVAPQEEREAVPVAHGRILVMEDEEDIRDVIGAILDHFGYEVAFARDGVEALAAYISAKDAGVPFDAVILDLTIPGGMGAKETIARLKAFDPEVRAIVASGYANDPLLANYRAFGFCGCIIKPFKSDELTKVLYHAIAGRESPTT